MVSFWMIMIGKLFVFIWKGDLENNLKVCYMKSIKELVEEYEVELVFVLINKCVCYELVKRIIFVN